KEAGTEIPYDAAAYCVDENNAPFTDGVLLDRCLAAWRAYYAETETCWPTFTCQGYTDVDNLCARYAEGSITSSEYLLNFNKCKQLYTGFYDDQNNHCLASCGNDYVDSTEQCEQGVAFTKTCADVGFEEALNCANLYISYSR
ncbi:MAG: hypothetical protein V1827_05455, partial [Candidatus Micrarchaeota archaeon]